MSLSANGSSTEVLAYYTDATEKFLQAPPTSKVSSPKEATYSLLAQVLATITEHEGLDSDALDHSLSPATSEDLHDEGNDKRLLF